MGNRRIDKDAADRVGLPCRSPHDAGPPEPRPEIGFWNCSTAAKAMPHLVKTFGGHLPPTLHVGVNANKQGLLISHISPDVKNEIWNQ